MSLLAVQTFGPTRSPSPAGVPGDLPVAAEPTTLGGLFRRYRWRLLFTYGLFNVENLLALAQPLVLGLAVNGLLAGSYRHLWLLAGQYLAHLMIGELRRCYDVRVFNGIYTTLATRVVVGQRRGRAAVSQIAARSALSRAFVEFFQRDVPVVVFALYSLVGGLLMLGYYDVSLVPWCLLLVVPAGVLNALYGRRALALNRTLHDEYEREVGVIERGREDEIRGHYAAVSRWRIRLSDWEAVSFGVMDLFTLALIAVSLIHFCARDGATAGAILAVLRYVLMFAQGLDGLPFMVQQLTRLRDICRRMHSGPSVPCLDLAPTAPAPVGVPASAVAIAARRLDGMQPFGEATVSAKGTVCG